MYKNDIESENRKKRERANIIERKQKNKKTLKEQPIFFSSAKKFFWNKLRWMLEQSLGSGKRKGGYAKWTPLYVC